MYEHYPKSINKHVQTCADELYNIRRTVRLSSKQAHAANITMLTSMLHDNHMRDITCVERARLTIENLKKQLYYS